MSVDSSHIPLYIHYRLGDEHQSGHINAICTERGPQVNVAMDDGKLVAGLFDRLWIVKDAVREALRKFSNNGLVLL